MSTKYIFIFLFVVILGVGIYLLYNYYQSKKGQAPATGGAKGAGAGGASIPNATNSTVEPNWSNVFIPHTKEFGQAMLLKKGTTGAPILVLQRYLNSLIPTGEPKLIYDGVYGDLTQAAIQKYITIAPAISADSISFSKIPADYVPANFYRP